MKLDAFLSGMLKTAQAAELKVYDKAKWHTDAGEPFEDIKGNFSVLMEKLHSNGMLSPEGKEIYQLGVGRDFSLHSRMLTDEGNKALQGDG